MEESLKNVLWAAAMGLTAREQRTLLAAVGTLDGAGRDIESAAGRAGLSGEATERLRDALKRYKSADFQRKMVALGIRVVNMAALTYRPGDARSADLPPLLFYRGNPDLLTVPGIAVVGSRKASPYGRRVAREIAQAAARAGRPVVSGAAFGIDAAAHAGALEAGGPTIAVMGGGLFHDYPPQHAELLANIAEKGLMVSQFAPDTAPLGRHFAVRNRVIAALSTDVVIVEGAADSGARHTADYARDLRRRLWAVPGEIGRPGTELPHRLLSEGARIVVQPEDPVAFDGGDVQYERPAVRRATERRHKTPSTGAEAGRGKSVAALEIGAAVEDDAAKTDRLQEEETAPAFALAGETDDLEQTLRSLLREGPLALDDLIRLSGRKAQEVAARLTLLELTGRVKRTADGRFAGESNKRKQ